MGGIKDERKQRQEKEEKEEDGPDNLPGSQAVLDHANSILAMGEGRRHNQDGRQSVDGYVHTRARGTIGPIEQYGTKPGPSQSHARGIVITQSGVGKEVKACESAR